MANVVRLTGRDAKIWDVGRAEATLVVRKFRNEIAETALDQKIATLNSRGRVDTALLDAKTELLDRVLLTLEGLLPGESVDGEYRPRFRGDGLEGAEP